MAALQEELSYGLSCGRVDSRVSIFHVKLTDIALKAFESYENSQDFTVPYVISSIIEGDIQNQ